MSQSVTKMGETINISRILLRNQKHECKVQEGWHKSIKLQTTWILLVLLSVRPLTVSDLQMSLKSVIY